MAHFKEICLLFVLGFVVLTSADPHFGGFSHIFHPCFFKRCHLYAKCEVKKGSSKAECVCPKSCPRLLREVCGTDWKTYRNGCELRKKSCEANSRLRIRYYGTCKSGSCRRSAWRYVRCPYGSKCEVNFGLPRCVCPQQTCSAVYKPVCGSDGKTYRNSCEIRKVACKERTQRKNHLYIRHWGHCRPDPCARIDCCCGAQCQVNETNHAKCVCNLACPRHYDPVCGSDGKTYGNGCTLRSVACSKQNPKLRAVSKGECPTPTTTTTPTTTSRISEEETTRTTIPPTTLTPCAVVKCGYFAKCEVKDGKANCVCPSLCPKIYKPVCGSNGVTYGNLCELQRDSCKKSQHIKVSNNGPCANTNLPTSTNFPDTTTMTPTSNPCAQMKCDFFSICEVKDGQAKCVCPKFCPNIPGFQRPSTTVCGTDGVTYGNLCELEKASCEQKKRIAAVKRGNCGPSLTCPVPRICLSFCDKNACEAQGKLCCCVGCGNVCTTPVKRIGRYNACPPNKDECFSDAFCPGGKKCCLDGCSKRCVDPVPTIDTQMNEMRDLEGLV